MSTRPVGALSGNARAVPIELDDVAVLGQQHLHRRSAPAMTRLRDARVLRQLAILAVDRHEVARPHQREHQLQFLRAAVSGHMDVFHRSR